MTTFLKKSFALAAVVFACSINLAHAQYTEQDNVLRVDSDGNVGGLLGIISHSSLSLSTLDSKGQHSSSAAIKIAETDAINFQMNKQTSVNFINAKSTIENMNNIKLSNEQAAIVIIELNQQFREQ